MFYAKNGIPSKTLEALTLLVTSNHSKNSAYTFHASKSEFINQLKIITKDIPEIYNSLNDQTYVVTRQVTPEDAKFAYTSHFDNYESTTLVPIIVPTSKMSGDIVVWEKARKKPRNRYLHFLSKLLFQNKFSMNLLKRLYLKNSRFQRFKKHHIAPGDFLMFDGFVDLHFNLPVDSGLRLSLLIHNDKAFKNSFIEKLIEKYSQYSVK